MVQGAAGRPLHPSALCSVGRAALVELMELRQENGLLHARLDEVVGGRARMQLMRGVASCKPAACAAQAAAPRRRPHTVAGLQALKQRPSVTASRGSPRERGGKGGLRGAGGRDRAVWTPAPGALGGLPGRHDDAVQALPAGPEDWAAAGRKSRTPDLRPGRVGAHLERGPALLSTTGRLLSHVQLF